MKWQLRFGNGERVVSSMLMCCVWVCAVPAAARAQAKFSSANCYIHINPEPKVSSQISCTAQVTGLNPKNAQTYMKYQFQKSDNGFKKSWSDMPQKGSLIGTGVNGTANFNSPWIPLTADGPPPPGMSYRVVVSAYYLDGNGNQVVIQSYTSDIITPSP